jgi:hypothetical protein
MIAYGSMRIGSRASSAFWVLLLLPPGMLIPLPLLLLLPLLLPALATWLLKWLACLLHINCIIHP